jgi:hypothetical protein
VSKNRLVAVFSRCNNPERHDEWNDWYDDVHLPEVVTSDTADVVTRWQLTVPPVQDMPSVGFSHVALYEFRGDREGAESEIDRRVDNLFEISERIETNGQSHPNHAVIDVHVLSSWGRYADKPDPSKALRGHIMAYVICNDRSRELEWDQWNDDVHMPDMMASQAFLAVSRWRRWEPTRYGANYLTLYDVGDIGLDEAVKRSADVMPALVSAGRKLECHTGAMVLKLKPAGRYAGSGYRPQM